MMKRILAATSVLAGVAALSTTAFATPSGSPITASITLNGNVAALCSVQNNPGTQVINLNTDLEDPSTGLLRANALAGLNASLGEVWCNGAHSSVTVTASPLTNTTPNSNPDFTNVVNYTLSGTPFSNTLDTAGGSTANPKSTGSLTVGIFDTTVTGAIAQDSGQNLKLVAGAYQGVITVALQPAS